MSNSRRLPKPKKQPGGYLSDQSGNPVTNRYAWLAAVRNDPNITKDKLVVVEAMAYAADETGYVSDEALYDALAVLGHPVIDRDDSRG